MSYKINKKAKINICYLYPERNVTWEYAKWYSNTPMLWRIKSFATGNDQVTFESNGLISLSSSCSYMIKNQGYNYQNESGEHDFRFFYEDDTEVKGQNSAQTKFGFSSVTNSNTNEGHILLLSHPTKKIKLVNNTQGIEYTYIHPYVRLLIMEFCL